jgi:hypothetical protein
MRIIAFVTDGVSVRGILEHTGEPTDSRCPVSVWSGRRTGLQRMTGLGRKADLRCNRSNPWAFWFRFSKNRNLLMISASAKKGFASVSSETICDRRPPAFFSVKLTANKTSSLFMRWVEGTFIVNFSYSFQPTAPRMGLFS